MENEKSYLLQNIEPFEATLIPVEESSPQIYSCFLSGEVQNLDIFLSRLELLDSLTEDAETDLSAQPDGFVYYEIDKELPIGGKFLYQKLEADGSLGTLYELTNLDRYDPETASLLESWPGLNIQITLNATVTEDLSGRQAPIQGPTRLLINNMTVIQDADPILDIEGNLIYHSWEDVIEVVATSPSLAEGSRRSFILHTIPERILEVLLSHPDQFLPVCGFIQVLQREKRSVNDPLIANALNLRMLINPD